MGEPTLHPKLPFFIKYVNEKNFKSRISSNLNVDADFEQILKSEPLNLKYHYLAFTKNNMEEHITEGI